MEFVQQGCRSVDWQERQYSTAAHIDAGTALVSAAQPTALDTHVHGSYSDAEKRSISGMIDSVTDNGHYSVTLRLDSG